MGGVAPDATGSGCSRRRVRGFGGLVNTSKQQPIKPGGGSPRPVQQHGLGANAAVNGISSLIAAASRDY